MGGRDIAMQVELKLRGPVAAGLRSAELLLSFEEKMNWRELFDLLEETRGLSLRHGVVTLINGKSIWDYLKLNEQIDQENVLIEVYPALAGG